MKIYKGKVYSSFIDNIWGADLAHMQLISKFNKGIRFYYVFLIFTVNTHGLFLWNMKKVFRFVYAFLKTFKRIESQTKQNIGR